jgi:hypothetical protein
MKFQLSSTINVVVSDTLPDEAEHFSASPHPITHDDTITWIISEIRARQTVKITMRVQLNEVPEGE